MTTAHGRRAIISDNLTMTGPSSSPLWRILYAPFTRRTWAELAYWIVSALLDVGALVFILPTLVNGLLWAASAPGVRKLGAASRFLARELLGDDVPAPPRLRSIEAFMVRTPHSTRLATSASAAGAEVRIWETKAGITAVAEHKPDVAIVDVRMPPDYADEGLRAAIAIRRDHPGTGILVFSQYVETRYAADLLSARSGGVGYLLKDRVADVGEFTDAIARVAAGGTALDPEVVAGMLNASRHASTLAALTARERDVLALMAEGRSNHAIAGHLVVSERAVEKHISNIFSKLGLPPSDSDHRRVLAVLAYLGS